MVLTTDFRSEVEIMPFLCMCKENEPTRLYVVPDRQSILLLQMEQRSKMAEIIQTLCKQLT